MARVAFGSDDHTVIHSTSSSVNYFEDDWFSQQVAAESHLSEYVENEALFQYQYHSSPLIPEVYDEPTWYELESQVPLQQNQAFIEQYLSDGLYDMKLEMQEPSTASDSFLLELSQTMLAQQQQQQQQQQRRQLQTTPEHIAAVASHIQTSRVTSLMEQENAITEEYIEQEIENSPHNDEIIFTEWHRRVETLYAKTSDGTQRRLSRIFSQLVANRNSLATKLIFGMVAGATAFLTAWALGLVAAGATTTAAAAAAASAASGSSAWSFVSSLWLRTLIRMLHQYGWDKWLLMRILPQLQQSAAVRSVVNMHVIPKVWQDMLRLQGVPDSVVAASMGSVADLVLTQGVSFMTSTDLANFFVMNTVQYGIPYSKSAALAVWKQLRSLIRQPNVVADSLVAEARDESLSVAMIHTVEKQMSASVNDYSHVQTVNRIDIQRQHALDVVANMIQVTPDGHTVASATATVTQPSQTRSLFARVAALRGLTQAATVTGISLAVSIWAGQLDASHVTSLLNGAVSNEMVQRVGASVLLGSSGVDRWLGKWATHLSVSALKQIKDLERPLMTLTPGSREHSHVVRTLFGLLLGQVILSEEQVSRMTRVDIEAQLRRSGMHPDKFPKPRTSVQQWRKVFLSHQRDLLSVTQETLIQQFLENTLTGVANAGLLEGTRLAYQSYGAVLLDCVNTATFSKLANLSEADIQALNLMSQDRSFIEAHLMPHAPGTTAEVAATASDLANPIRMQALQAIDKIERFLAEHPAIAAEMAAVVDSGQTAPAAQISGVSMRIQGVAAAISSSTQGVPVNAQTLQAQVDAIHRERVDRANAFQEAQRIEAEALAEVQRIQTVKRMEAEAIAETERMRNAALAEAERIHTLRQMEAEALAEAERRRIQARLEAERLEAVRQMEEQARLESERIHAEAVAEAERIRVLQQMEAEMLAEAERRQIQARLEAERLEAVRQMEEQARLESKRIHAEAVAEAERIRVLRQMEADALAEVERRQVQARLEEERRETVRRVEEQARLETERIRAEAITESRRVHEAQTAANAAVREATRQARIDKHFERYARRYGLSSAQRQGVQHMRDLQKLVDEAQMAKSGVYQRPLTGTYTSATTNTTNTTTINASTILLDPVVMRSVELGTFDPEHMVPHHLREEFKRVQFTPIYQVLRDQLMDKVSGQIEDVWLSGFGAMRLEANKYILSVNAAKNTYNVAVGLNRYFNFLEMAADHLGYLPESDIPSIDRLLFGTVRIPPVSLMSLLTSALVKQVQHGWTNKQVMAEIALQMLGKDAAQADIDALWSQFG